MKKIFQLAVMSAALVGSASLAMAQDGGTRGGRGYGYGSGYNGSVETGPYTAPRHQPARPGLPFTWEEKRHFDMANGEQG